MDVVSRYDQLRNADLDNLVSLQEEAENLREKIQTLRVTNEHLRALLRSPDYAGANEMVIRPNMPRRDLDLWTQVGFLIMPFGPPWSSDVEQAIRTAHTDCGMRCRRADQQSGRHIVQDDIWPGICESGVIIADITETNPNVMYELGLADAIGKKIILISQTPDPSKIAFDLLGLRLIVYSPTVDGLSNLRATLAEKIRKIRSARAVGGNG